MTKILIEEATVMQVLEALEGIHRYGLDTLSGRSDGPDDRDWQRAGVNEMTKRARIGFTALREALAKPDFWEGYVPEPDKRQQALDKKAENARELGLDYEPAQQEPVAWREFDGEGGYFYRDYYMNEQYAQEWDQRNPDHKGWVEPLYTSPPAQRTWVSLTDWERDDVLDNYLTDEGRAQAIEAKLRSKNT